MEKAPSPEEQFRTFCLLFSEMTNDKVIECFNKEVGNTGWTSSRGAYLAALHSEFDQREWDYREIGNERSLSFKHHIHLIGKRVSVFSGS